MFIQTAEPVSLNQENALEGLPTTFGENFDIARNNQLRNESQFGLETEFINLYEKNMDKVFSLTGEKFNQPLAVTSFFEYAQDREQKDLFRLGEETGYLNTLKKQNERLAELKKQYPDIQTLDELWANVKSEAQKIDSEFENISSRATFSGTIGNFMGAMVGSFSMRDPLNVLTLGLGGVGRSVLAKVLTEAGAAGGVEAVNQFTGVTQNRELLGLENSFGRGLNNVIYAGAGAGVLRATGEGVGAAAKAYKGSDKQLLKDFTSKFKKHTETEKTAIQAMERDIEFIQDANPYSKDIEGEAFHLKRMEEAEGFLNGKSVGPERFDDVPPIGQEDFDIEVSKVRSDIAKYIEQARKIKEQIKNEKVFDYNNPQSFKRELGYTPESLSQFVKNRGGIQDAGGEIRDIQSRLPGLIVKGDKKIKTLQGEFITRTNIDAVKEAAFEQGYFPSKADYDEITNDEFFDALKSDLDGQKIYKLSDAEKINELNTSESLADQYYREGITPDMDDIEIADILRDQDIIKQFDEIDEYYRNEINQSYHDDLARHIGETYDYINDMADEIVDTELEEVRNLKGDIYTGVELDEEGNLSPTTQKISDIIAEIEEDDALVAASKGCAL